MAAVAGQSITSVQTEILLIIQIIEISMLYRHSAPPEVNPNDFGLTLKLEWLYISSHSYLFYVFFLL